MDIYQHLLADHGKQRALIGAIREAVARPVEALLFLGELQEEVAVNQAAEEQTLYRDVLSRCDDQVWVRRSIEQHGTIAQLIDDLTAMDPRCEAWAAGLEDLAERLARHLDCEDAAVSAYLRSSVGSDRAEALARHYQAIKSLEIDLWGNAIRASQGPGRADTVVAG